ncbi:hypothetical protein RH858_04760 [Halalkaliarchaeum sp. AArc-GB]|uniref:hypothetical protein n=1 Tax=Halalkaliarchaeum sp. AArc-GB TaxID=3074078 RepID=UPI002854FEA8|nr:hypothetical protein [Halalkaliarchaeum sp. AArc-GB]MDR5672460.1 hypothetical protein [Halalkaliarchaeum sp. AArc-GB]
MIQTQIGELIVGSYLRIIQDCELVSYNQRSKDAGRQMEIDVLGVESQSGEQTVYACEVVTHLHGTLYSGTPDEGWWNKYGNEGYQYTLNRLWEKFEEDLDLLKDVFDDADNYRLQFWSPVVPKGTLPEGFEEMQERFRDKHGEDIEVLINEDYTVKIRELEKEAARTKKSYDEPAFRFLQVLQHLRE